MIGRWIYRTFFKSTFDRLELILFIDRMARNGIHYDEAAAKRDIEQFR